MHRNSKVFQKDPSCYAYIDGSFNIRTNTVGYGVVLCYKGEFFELQGSEEDLEQLQSVAGEIKGAVVAVTKAVELGSRTVDIYHDFIGVEGWAVGRWKPNKKGTRQYVAFMQDMSKSIQITFHRVPAHTGVKLNERADQLARQAAGITV